MNGLAWALVALSSGLAVIGGAFVVLSVSRGSALLIGALAVGIGLGIASCVYFAWRVSSLPTAALPILDCLWVGGAGAVYWVRRRNPHLLKVPLSTEWGGGFRGWGERLLFGIFALLLIIDLGGFVALTAANPHGDWDAWAIWNMRARFMARGGAAWSDGFSPVIVWSHPDYPALVSGLAARGWLYSGLESGHETQTAPALNAFLFTCATLALLIGGLAERRGARQALIGGVALLGTSGFILYGAAQYADIPLSFQILAVIVLLTRALLTRGDTLLAGIAVGLAAWTKNEGLYFALIVVGLLVIGRDRRRLAWLGAGLLPPLLIAVGFKLGYAPPDYLINEAGADTLHKLIDPARYARIAAEFVTQTFQLGAGMALIVALYGVLVRFERGAWARARLPLAILGVLLIGYFGAYLITPRDLNWQLTHSLDRLLLHVWPSALYLAFSAFRGQGTATAQTT